MHDLPGSIRSRSASIRPGERGRPNISCRAGSAGPHRSTDWSLDEARHHCEVCGDRCSAVAAAWARNDEYLRLPRPSLASTASRSVRMGSAEAESGSARNRWLSALSSTIIRHDPDPLRAGTAAVGDPAKTSSFGSVAVRSRGEPASRRAGTVARRVVRRLAPARRARAVGPGTTPAAARAPR